MKAGARPPGRVYFLRPLEPVPKELRIRRKIVPPKPKAGERRPRAYPTDDLDGLYATAHSVDWKCLVSLKTPPHCRIVTHSELTKTLTKMKRFLENGRKRHDYPAAIVVTEFDPHTQGEVPIDAAHFHIGFAAELDDQQQAILRSWWLDLMGSNNNQGRAYDYRAKGGGTKLQAYLAKDISYRHGTKRPVKYPVEWLPTRIDCRLWFVVGTKRLSAKNGRALRLCMAKKRKRFESESLRGDGKASVEGEHGLLPITTDAQAKPGHGLDPRQGEHFLVPMHRRPATKQAAPSRATLYRWLHEANTFIYFVVAEAPRPTEKFELHSRGARSPPTPQG